MQAAFRRDSAEPDRYGYYLSFVRVVQRDNIIPCFIKAAVGNYAISAVQRAQRAGTQCPMLLPQGNQFFVESNQRIVLLAPRVGTAVVRVCPADHSGLVPIIHRRRAGPCHLEQHRFPHDCLIHIFSRGLRSFVFQPARPAVCPRQKTGVVVIGKLVHGNLYCLSRKAAHLVNHTAPECVGIVI